MSWKLYNNTSSDKLLVDDADNKDMEDNGTYTCDGYEVMISGEAGSVWYRCIDCVYVYRP